MSLAWGFCKDSGAGYWVARFWVLGAGYWEVYRNFLDSIIYKEPSFSMVKLNSVHVAQDSNLVFGFKFQLPV